MSGFLDELRTTTLPGRDRVRRLLAELRYRTPGGATWTVPAGFESDGASVPRLALVLIAPWDRAERASWLHDWLYETRSTARSTADWLFRRAMADDGVAAWRRWLVWAAVRLAGGAVWTGRLRTDGSAP